MYVKRRVCTLVCRAQFSRDILPVAHAAAGVARRGGAAKGLAQSCERIISQEAEAVAACRPTLRAAAGVSGWSL